MEKHRGKFITLEGGEGAGKSTQVARLAAFLRGHGIEVCETREPGGTPGAEAIRGLLVEGDPGRWTPMTEALLHSAARADHLARLIRPALAAGRWVVCDRFTDSTLAYQGYGHNLGVERIGALNDLVSDEIKPDLTLILDIAPDDGLARARDRSRSPGQTQINGCEDRYERMARDFHDRLRAGFLAIAAAEPDRCVVIDAGADVDSVARAIKTATSQRLGLS